MSLYARLAILLAILAALGASHWKAYTSGKKATQAEWDAEKITLQQAAIEAQQANAETARLARKSVERLDHDLQTARKARDAAAVADADSVRRIESALGNQAGAQASAPPRADADPTNAILGQCIQQVAGMAQEARGLASQAQGLQRYASEVCMK